MKLEEQVVSLKLAKKLKKLGVKQESCFLWLVGDDGYSTIADGNYEGNEEGRYAAFTTAELGSMLPTSITRDDKKKFKLYFAKEQGDFSDETRWFVEYHEVRFVSTEEGYELEVQRCADTEADARAKMLIYLVENARVGV